MKLPKIAAVLSVMLVSPLAASAAPKPTLPKTTRPLPKGNPKIPTQPVQPKAMPVEITKSGTGTVSESRAELGGGTYGLSGFDFRFDNGDHAIKAISVLQDDEIVSAQFNDNDGNDPYTVWTSFSPLGSARTFDTGTRAALLNSDIAIERPRAGEVFVLTGFQLTRRRSDTRVKRIAIRPSPERGVVRVEFMNDALPGPNNHWSVRLQYAYVPAGAVAGQHATSHPEAGFDKKPAVLSRVSGQPVLQGFDIYFPRGQNFLRDFSIRAKPETFEVEFNDGGHDDYIMASVDYVILR